MRKLISLFFLVTTFPAFAYDGDCAALFNQISFQLTAEQWVTTKTALVTIIVNAGVSDKGVDPVQTEVLGKLNKISDQGSWHLISLERTQDQSGLEKIQIIAQARLASSALAGLRDKTKALSQPGETFTLDNLQFIPSEEEYRAANVDLRSNIYQQAKEEVDRVNKAYASSKYYIHSIDFRGTVIPIQMPQNTMMAAKMGQAEGAQLPVGDKLSLAATVILAAKPDQLAATVKS